MVNEYLVASKIKTYLNYQSAEFSANVERVRFFKFCVEL